MGFEDFLNALVSGLLLGGFYAALAVGVTIAFGMIDVVNIAHPAFIIMSAFIVFFLTGGVGIDPLIAGLILMPAAFVLGRIIYKFYHHTFERKHDDSLQGLAFFFGLLFCIEVGLVLAVGADFRFVSAPYIDTNWSIGFLDLQGRYLVPCLASLAMVVAVQVFLDRTYVGRAILAVSQDPTALRLVGGNPVRIKEIAFGLSLATAAFAGALLILIQPVEPSIGRELIGRAFAICVLGGMTSIRGTVIAAALLGVCESLTMTFWSASWAPAIAFGLLLTALAFKPTGLLRR